MDPHMDVTESGISNIEISALTTFPLNININMNMNKNIYLILQYISWKLFLHNISSPMRIDRNYKVSLVLSSFPFSHFVTD